MKDMEQVLEEEELQKISTDVEVLKQEFEGIKRDQLLNEQQDAKLKQALSDLKKATEASETQFGREMKQVQSNIKELGRQCNALNQNEEALSSFVTGNEMRDQISIGIAKVTKALEKYKVYMEPIEKMVLGTSATKSLQNQIDEINH